jgi:hypothetical protein
MAPIRFPSFDEGDTSKSCQHCGRRKAAVRGGRPPRFGFCLECALGVLPAIIAAAVVAQARGQRRQQAVACRGFRRVTEAYWWGELRLDDDCLFPLEWIDGVERRVLDALTDAGPAAPRT